MLQDNNQQLYAAQTALTPAFLTSLLTQAARQGVTVVEQSSRGMDTIRGRTTEAVEKVKEMEMRSKTKFTPEEIKLMLFLKGQVEQ